MTAEKPYYYGRAENRLNTKGQVAIPARFRAIIPEEDKQRNYAIVRGENDNCLYMYTHRQFTAVIENVQRVADELQDDDYFRKFMAEVHAVDIDTQGRFVLPQALMRLAGIKGPDILFIGMGSRIEIWEPEAYRQSGGPEEQYESIRKQTAKRVFKV